MKILLSVKNFKPRLVVIFLVYFVLAIAFLVFGFISRDVSAIIAGFGGITASVMLGLGLVFSYTHQKSV